jgi:hypothetical protein
MIIKISKYSQWVNTKSKHIKLYQELFKFVQNLLGSVKLSEYKKFTNYYFYFKPE